MPETQTGWQNKIAEHCFEHMIAVSRGQIKKMAYKIHKRAIESQEPLDFEHALRILGIHSDTTARDAARNLEGLAA